MPKCVYTVILVAASNILTLTIYSTFKYEYNSALHHPDDKRGHFSRLPQPQPFQLEPTAAAQVGRVIQSVMPSTETNLNSSATTSMAETYSFSAATFKERRRKVVDYCTEKKLHPTSSLPLGNDPTKLMVLRDRNVVYCPVFKAGSSTWLSILVDLSSKTQAQKEYIRKRNANNLLQQGRSVAPTLAKTAWYKYKSLAKRTNQSEASFIVVRHPFERLVSAFRDKLERKHTKSYITDWYYKAYGKKIVAKYRKTALQRFGDKHFSEGNNYGALLPVRDQNRPSSDLPIFWEFVQFVLASKPTVMDEHWKPASLYCSACMIDYDYIVKFEDYFREGETFLKMANLTRFVPENLLERHINPNRPDQMSSEDVTKLYFGTLTDSEIRNLYLVYQDDFKMFGYTFQFRNVSLP